MTMGNSDDENGEICLTENIFFGGGPGLFELLCEVVDEDAADDVEGEAARGVDAGDGDVVVLVAEDGGVGDARDRTRPSTSRSTACLSRRGSA